MKSCDKILNYLQQVVEQMGTDTDLATGNESLRYALTANGVADALQIKRNFASHHLNRLVDEGQLQKSQTRPVYFYPMVEKASISPQNLVIDNKSVQREVVDPLGPSNPFSDLIGYQGSLKDIVEQCKSTVLYPPKGLPILLCGASGVGKSILAQKIYRFAIEAQLLAADAPFITLNCAEYANNQELLSAALFGYAKGAFTGADSERSGMLEAANHGILFLDEMHRLSPESQEKLFLFLDQGVYRRLGESSGWRRAQVRLVFATTVSLDAVNGMGENVMLDTFLRRIPLIVKVPTYSERPLSERLQLIKYLFHREAVSLKKTIHVSGQVIRVLAGTALKGNIGNLENAIKLSCATALSERYQRSDLVTLDTNGLPESLFIRLPYLPKVYYRSLNEQLLQGERFEDWTITEALYLVQILDPEGLESYNAFRTGVSTFEHPSQLSDALKSLNTLIDALIFKASSDPHSPVYAAIEKMVSYCLVDFQRQYGMQYLGNSAHVISHLIFSIYQWGKHANHKEDAVYVERVKYLLTKEHRLALQLLNLVSKQLDESMPPMLEIMLALYLKSIQREVQQKYANGVIIAHGYATASSIASVANRLLGHYIYDAFDMPLDVSAVAIGKQLKEYITQMDNSQGLIILVDMGSLEKIYESIGLTEVCEIAIINNITTQLALDVGSRLMARESIEDIAKQTVSRHEHRYHYIPGNQPKQSAILVTCSTGIGTADKIRGLLAGCFDSNTIEIIAYDYDRIRSNRKEDSVFKQYDVKLIIGTTDPSIDMLPYVSLEDLMMERDMDLITSALCDVASLDDIAKMHREMIRVFTLENILNVLTILNPDKVAQQVDQALNRLEVRLGHKLMNVHRMSLTVHLSCMIERLVMKAPLPLKAHVSDFEIAHSGFISIVKDVFSNVEGFYHIEIPISEIAFIYENISYRVKHLKV